MVYNFHKFFGGFCSFFEFIFGATVSDIDH
jgi:hypothetical protein